MKSGCTRDLAAGGDLRLIRPYLKLSSRQIERQQDDTKSITASTSSSPQPAHPPPLLEQWVIITAAGLPQWELALAPVRPLRGNHMEARDLQVDRRLGLMLGAAPHHFKHSGVIWTGRDQLQQASGRHFAPLLYRLRVA